MVKPNQIINRNGSEFTFIMFARSESQVKRRVVALNFPSVFARLFISDTTVDDLVTDVEVLMDSTITRYAVTVDTEAIAEV